MEDGIGDHYIGTYIVDTFMRTVTDQKTKKSYMTILQLLNILKLL